MPDIPLAGAHMNVVNQPPPSQPQTSPLAPYPIPVAPVAAPQNISQQNPIALYPQNEGFTLNHTRAKKAQPYRKLLNP